MKENCIKCKNYAQILTCQGCQQTFCKEHVVEHREELANKMDHITQKYHQFEEDLHKNDAIQPYLTRIDQWEHESISKIQRTAEIARNDLLKMFDRMKNQLQSSIETIKSTIHSTEQSKTYTESHLNKWMKQLKQLRHIHKTSFVDDVIDDNHSSIRLIKIIDKKQVFTLDGVQPYPREKFNRIVGKISLSQDHLTATCTGNNWNGSTICGSNSYVSGIHSIRFRITKNGPNNPFFGITSSLNEPNPWNRKTPFAYGWWRIPLDDKTPEDDKNKSKDDNVADSTLRTNDEVTLTLNCINNELEFENHRTKQYIYEPIAYEKCPFPWTLAIVLYSPGDSISILS